MPSEDWDQVKALLGVIAWGVVLGVVLYPVLRWAGLIVPRDPTPAAEPHLPVGAYESLMREARIILDGTWLEGDHRAAG